MSGSRRIRRLRKPTRWQLWVRRWHEWIEDALARAVCCGIDPSTIPEVEDLRFAFGDRKASSVLSIMMMSVYDDEDRDSVGDADAHEKAHDKETAMSETDSESTTSGDPHNPSDRRQSIDMTLRNSCIECDDNDDGYGCVDNSEYIPFDDDDDLWARYRDPRRLRPAPSAVAMNDEISYEQEHPSKYSAAETALYHRALFNCVLVDLLSSYHPVEY